ncbi:hypothetical protein AP057_15540 [Geobacillus sp. Sah69]|nr:hypothetical protein AP057_15540 [Geobacillus sp. Sah69]
MDIIPINKIDKLSYLEAVEKIIELNEHIYSQIVRQVFVRRIDPLNLDTSYLILGYSQNFSFFLGKKTKSSCLIRELL